MKRLNILCAFVLAFGCVPALQRTLPRATNSHVTVLSRGEPFLRVVAPRTFSSIWNAVGRSISAECGGVVQEDPSTGTFVSDYAYVQSSSSDGMVAVQQRRRVTVVVPPGTIDAERIRVSVAIERRERRAGSATSEWMPVGSGDPAVEEPLRMRLRDAAAGERRLELGNVTWSAEPEDAARAVARHLTHYDVAAGSDPTLLQTEWRVTEEAMDNDRLLVRSRFRVLFDRVAPAATRASVGAEMQYRVARAGEASEGGWTDLDPEPLVAHGWATIQQTLTPFVGAAVDEPIEHFARAPGAPPDLSDPREAWARSDAPMPSGVARTTSGGSVELAWLGEENALDLLGRALSADLQPAGRVDLMGEPVERVIQEENVLMSALSVGDQTELSAGYLILSGRVGTTSERTVVVHEAFADEHRYEVPEFASFAAVDRSARYFVASVTTGRAVAVSFIGTSSSLTVGADVAYEGFRAGIESSVRRRDVRCAVRGRGVATSLSCDESHVPTAAEVVRARDGGDRLAPMVTRVVLRRLPATAMPVAVPQTTTITRFTVDGSACSDAFDDPADLEIAWSIDGAPANTTRCQDNQSACSLAIDLPVGARQITFNATDRDFAFDDPCGRVTYDISRWRVGDVPSALPGPIVGRDHQDRFTVEYRLLY